MDIEVEALEKKVKELKEERVGMDEQIKFAQGQIQSVINNNPQIQMLNQQINKLVADRNVKTGTINAFEELVKMAKGDPELPEEETGPEPAKKSKMVIPFLSAEHAKIASITAYKDLG